MRKRLEQLWDSEVVRFLRESVLLYFSCRAPQAAACLAYFLLLTVFPLLICVSYILGMVNIDIASFITSLESVLPKEALSVLSGYLGYISAHQGAGLFIAGLMACWFSAAAAQGDVLTQGPEGVPLPVPELHAGIRSGGRGGLRRGSFLP